MCSYVELEQVRGATVPTTGTPQLAPPLWRACLDMYKIRIALCRPEVLQAIWNDWPYFAAGSLTHSEALLPRRALIRELATGTNPQFADCHALAGWHLWATRRWPSAVDATHYLA